MYVLDSGVELNRQYPSTFIIPSKEEISQLKIGDLVKLVFREDTAGERMWVKISDISLTGDHNSFVGTLDNEPYELETIKYGDTVIFSPEHVIQIFE